MLILTCLITIETTLGVIELQNVNRVVIEKSLKGSTDTAKIMIAKNLLVKGADFAKKPISEILKSGDKVKVELGYNGQLNTRFVGYVSRVTPQVPLVIECEDEMWQMKRKAVSAKAFKGGTLKQVIDYIAPDLKTDVLDTDLGGRFLIASDEPTAMAVLKKIEQVYGIKSTFILDGDTPVLVVGKQYLNTINTDEIKYKLNQNVISNDLELVRAEDVKVKVSVVSRQSDGKVLKNEFVGDENGSLKKLVIPNLSQAQVEAYAKRIYNESKVDRFDGSIKTFGWPEANIGQVASVDTDEYEIAQTSNYIDTVEIEFGVDGYRQKIELGEKA